MRYLLPAMLNTARPSLRMLALPMARFTSAGVAQSATLTCRYQAINGSRASAYAGLRLTKTLSVPSAMILTNELYHSPTLGPTRISNSKDQIFGIYQPAPRLSLHHPNLTPTPP